MERNFHFNLINNQQWKSQNFYCDIWDYDWLLENTHSKLHIENITLWYFQELYPRHLKDKSLKMVRKKIPLQFLNSVKEINKNLNHPLVWSLFLKNIYLSTDPPDFPMESVNSESGTNRQLQLRWSRKWTAGALLHSRPWMESSEHHQYHTEIQTQFIQHLGWNDSFCLGDKREELRLWHFLPWHRPYLLTSVKHVRYYSDSVECFWLINNLSCFCPDERNPDSRRWSTKDIFLTFSIKVNKCITGLEEWNAPDSKNCDLAYKLLQIIP